VRAAKIPSLPVENQLPRLALVPRMIRYVPRQYRRHYVALEGSFADYLGKFSAKSRSTLRRKVRKFEEFSGGAIHWAEYHRPEVMAEFQRLAREVSEKTYQEKMFQAGLPAGDDFLKAMADQAARNAARGYLLFHQGKPIAYLFCPVQEGNLLYQYVGYDPAFEQWSPGTVLLFLVLEKLFAEGGKAAFDFTEGEGPHKEFFANRSTPCADVFFFPRTPYYLALVTVHSGLFYFSRGVTRVLDRLGVKARLKKLLRSHS
jgi:CelD/BcsL family acetyltransferase involved in cellulose biosynthesis